MNPLDEATEILSKVGIIIKPAHYEYVSPLDIPLYSIDPTEYRNGDYLGFTSEDYEIVDEIESENTEYEENADIIEKLYD